MISPQKFFFTEYFGDRYEYCTASHSLMTFNRADSKGKQRMTSDSALNDWVTRLKNDIFLAVLFPFPNIPSSVFFLLAFAKQKNSSSVFHPVQPSHKRSREWTLPQRTRSTCGYLASKTRRSSGWRFTFAWTISPFSSTPPRPSSPPPSRAPISWAWAFPIWMACGIWWEIHDSKKKWKKITLSGPAFFESFSCCVCVVPSGFDPAYPVATGRRRIVSCLRVSAPATR